MKKWLTAKACFGLFPANSEEDDILIYDTENIKEEKFRLITLRQQLQKREGQPNLALADFVALKSKRRTRLYRYFLCLNWIWCSRNC